MLIILKTPVKEDEHEEDPVTLLDAVLGEALDEAEALPQVAFVDWHDQEGPRVQKAPGWFLAPLALAPFDQAASGGGCKV